MQCVCDSAQGLGMAALSAAPLCCYLALLLFFENPTRLALIISTLLPPSALCLRATFLPTYLSLMFFLIEASLFYPDILGHMISHWGMVSFSGATLLGKTDPSLPSVVGWQPLPSWRQDFIPTASSCWDLVCLDLPRSCACCHTAVRSYALLVLAIRSCAWLLKTKSSQHFQTSVKNKYLSESSDPKLRISLALHN